MGNVRQFSPGIPGFSFDDLHRPERLADLLHAFDTWLRESAPSAYRALEALRQGDGQREPTEHSALLLEVAPHVSRFLGILFRVEDALNEQVERTRDEVSAWVAFRDTFVDGAEKSAGEMPPDPAASQVLHAKMTALLNALGPGEQTSDDFGETPETTLCRLAKILLDAGSDHTADETPASTDTIAQRVEGLHQRLAEDAALGSQFPEIVEIDVQNLVQELLVFLRRWTQAALTDPVVQTQVSDWTIFRKRARVNFQNLVDTQPAAGLPYTALQIPVAQVRHRDGFALTDQRFDSPEIVREIDHCIYCHERDRDACAKGMRKKDGSYRENPLGATLSGCPLGEKISEAQRLARDGEQLAALALIMVDNPLVPGTGHRICNDCMKACIYQKVEPVDIPQIETHILTRILSLPYGFEIYALLTRWNPLNTRRPHALPYNGHKVLVVGLGPAGYTLSHYLLNEGFSVAGIDGLKIEPLESGLTGNDTMTPTPVRHFAQLHEELDTRVMAGFGGVAEYGITVRWDKNFLKVIRLTLARRRGFRCYGGVRFGGTLTADDVWRLGFHHIAVASGAGRPTIVDLKNNLLRGVRKASDFLMALQLTGAAKREAMANLQIRLPAGVVGGGLTAIDTATEVMAYYPLQVEGILQRYETLVATISEGDFWGGFDEEEQTILREFLGHGRAVREERRLAAAENRPPDFISLVNAWGGVTVYYRRRLQDAPAYRQNHEEVRKALEEGIVFAPQMEPLEARPDEHGHLQAVQFKLSGADGKSGELTIALRSLFIAAGTSPNTIYETEHPGTFELDGKFFRRYRPVERGGQFQLVPAIGANDDEADGTGFFTSYNKDGRFISFFGDNHPDYAGNVVKAMASAKDGYPGIAALFTSTTENQDPSAQPARNEERDKFLDGLDAHLLARVREVRRLTPTIVEVIVHAPAQAANFQPGQFYRLQNFETTAPRVHDTPLLAEGLALTGAWVDAEQGLISLIALEMGVSSRLCALLQVDEPVVVMGPTGSPSRIPQDSTVLLAGGGLGNAVLFSIGKALRAAGNTVVYFAGYKQAEDVFKVEEIEAASDVIVWAVDPAPGVIPLPSTRPQDKSIVANIIDAMVAYGDGSLGDTAVPLTSVEHILVIGSDRMMAALKSARRGALKPYLQAEHVAMGSINSSMQCMMKGVCAQCLCKQLDPDTGAERFVYSCFDQDQDLDWVDFPNLAARLRQNSVQEKLSNLWLDRLLKDYPGPRT